jgi:hypothetical protein
VGGANTSGTDAVHSVDAAVVIGPQAVDGPHVRPEVVEVPVGKATEGTGVFHIVGEEIDPHGPLEPPKVLKSIVCPMERSPRALGIDDGDLIGDLVDGENVQELIGIAGAQGHSRQESGHQSLLIHGLFLSPSYQVPWKPMLSERANGYP